MYNAKERYDDVKCPAFTRQLRRALTALELKEALGLLDMLESAAVSDRKGTIQHRVIGSLFAVNIN